MGSPPARSVPRALVDSGAIVALVNRDDRYHAPAVAWFRAYRGEMLTTDAVVTETAYVLAASPPHQTAALCWFERARAANLLRVVPIVKRLGAPLIAIVGRVASSLATEADVVLDVSVAEEACPLGLAPTASTTAALAMGDALAMALIERRGFSAEQFAARHPGGNIGRRFLRVVDLMHTGDRLPVVTLDTSIGEAIFEMTSKGFGATTVVDADGRLEGIITDGDLRRLLARHPADALSVRAADAMTVRPRTVDGDELAAGALEIMERLHITSLVVLDEASRPAGILHIHDLWRTQLF